MMDTFTILTSPNYTSPWKNHEKPKLLTNLHLATKKKYNITRLAKPKDERSSLENYLEDHPI